MNILFIHQNFPAQFKFLAPELLKRGHDVRAMILSKDEVEKFKGVYIYSYYPSKGSSKEVHPWASDFETKIIRAEAFFKAALKLKNTGYIPDIIIAHHGWGESLFVKQVWPNVRLGIYCEFFYHVNGADTNFDPEFPLDELGDRCRLILKNINNLLHFEIADAGISPTNWQASLFPERFQSKITVIHDGIDTNALKPNSLASLIIGNLKISKSDEVITFVNRNLEPYRGYHIFMRSLPEILKRRPNALVMIVGGDDVSYGARPSGGRKWKDIFANEIYHDLPVGAKERIYFLGTIPYQSYVTLLQLSSVHIYLTYPFVLGWSLLEAMSVGCAIVASKTKPVQEVIQNNINGRLVNFFDVHELVYQVCDLLQNEVDRQKLGNNARISAVASFDLESVCLPKQLRWVENLTRDNTF